MKNDENLPKLKKKYANQLLGALGDFVKKLFLLLFLFYFSNIINKKGWKRQKRIIFWVELHSTKVQTISPKQQHRSAQMVEQAQTFIASKGSNLAQNPMWVDFKYSKFNNNTMSRLIWFQKEFIVIFIRTNAPSKRRHMAYGYWKHLVPLMFKDLLNFLLN